MKKFLLLPAIIILVLFLFAQLPALAAAPIGNYLVLNGGYVKATNPSISIPSSFIFKASIYPTTLGGKQIILSIGDKSLSKRYYEIGINGGLIFVDYGYNGFNSQIKSSGLAAGSWQDINVEVSSSQTKLYIDGVLVTGPFITNNLGPIGPNIVLGNNYKESVSDSKPFKGLMDEVNISNGSIPILQWHLDEARGAVVADDSTPNNFDGTLVGGDILIHFYGVLPTPTPMQSGLPPISWSRPVFPNLSLSGRINPLPTYTIDQPSSNPTLPPSSIRNVPRRNL